MVIRLLVLYLFCLQTVPPKHFHAFQVTSAGKNIIVNVEFARYTSCNVEVVCTHDHIWFGDRSYQVYKRERTGDFADTYFCMHSVGRDSVDCSITVVPIEKTSQWYLMICWQDSTKAYKANVVLK